MNDQIKTLLQPLLDRANALKSMGVPGLMLGKAPYAAAGLTKQLAREIQSELFSYYVGSNDYLTVHMVMLDHQNRKVNTELLGLYTSVRGQIKQVIRTMPLAEAKALDREVKSQARHLRGIVRDALADD